MKFTLFILLFIPLVAASQVELTSFYIPDLKPMNNSFPDSIPNDFDGKYVSKSDTTRYIVIQEDSIVFAKTLTSFLSLDQIMGKSEWYLSDGRLFGVIKDKGLVYVEDNDTIYFNIPMSYTKYRPGDDSQFKIDYLDEKKIVLYEKLVHGWVIVAVLRLDKKSLEMCPFDHDYVVDKIERWSSVEEKTMEGYRTFIAAPSKNELLDILNDKRAFKNIHIYTLDN